MQCIFKNTSVGWSKAAKEKNIWWGYECCYLQRHRAMRGLRTGFSWFPGTFAGQIGVNPCTGRFGFLVFHISIEERTNSDCFVGCENRSHHELKRNKNFDQFLNSSTEEKQIDRSVLYLKRGLLKYSAYPNIWVKMVYFAEYSSFNYILVMHS